METLLKWHTDYNADSVEWCPVEEFMNLLVCGTYQLKKEETGDNGKQTKVGKLYLFEYQQDMTELEPLQTIEMAAILDQKWCHHLINGIPTLAVATSEGTILIFRYIENKLVMAAKESLQQEVLALSLDWSSNKESSVAPDLVVSDSKGYIHLFSLSGDNLIQKGSWKGHDFEAWIAGFNYWDTNTFYSGGDDCVFKSYDRRVDTQAVCTNRSHSAGVTSMHSNIHTEFQLITGSYDENVRLWDMRCLRRPVCSAAAGGGVWRLKWHPRGAGLLAACMHGGVSLLRLDGDTVRATAEYRQHESIAYGADWRRDGGIVATCSFYDCMMHLCRVIE